MVDIVWRYLNPGRLTPIEEALIVQEELFQQKLDGDPQNYILFTEHEPVYTYPPRVARELKQLCKVDSELLPAPLYEMPEQRGGSITFHGPGQLVCYLITDLPVATFGLLGANKFLASLDGFLRETLVHFGIHSIQRPATLPPIADGVWIMENGIPKKLASHGICARRTRMSQATPITKYGWALNVYTDLSYFDYIYPCGCEIQMTSIQEQTGCVYSMQAMTEVIAPALAQKLMRDLSR